MIKSMTGYGIGECFIDTIGLKIEIRTVNHRYLDISIRMPRQLNSFEDVIRKYITSSISRGKADVYVNFNNNGAGTGNGRGTGTGTIPKTVILDEGLLDSYMAALERVVEKYPELARNMQNIDLTDLQDLMKVDIPPLEGDDVRSCIEEALEKAVKNLISMREAEGARLEEDLRSKISSAESICSLIKERAPQVVVEYKKRLEERITELLGQHTVDESRIAQEVAFFADRCSIDEELVRLSSHFKQFVLTLGEGNGRKLDFIVQEMNREANTIGSKSNDLEITKYTVELKCEIEKMREQVQNIE